MQMPSIFSSRPYKFCWLNDSIDTILGISNCMRVANKFDGSGLPLSNQRIQSVLWNQHMIISQKLFIFQKEVVRQKVQLRLLIKKKKRNLNTVLSLKQVMFSAYSCSSMA